MQKQWPFVMLAGGALIAIAFVVVLVPPNKCGAALAMRYPDSDSCSIAAGLAFAWFWILIVLGVSTVIAGFMLWSRHIRGQR